MKKVAILASGTGSNARKIYEYSLTSDHYVVDCILSNRKNARVLDYADEHGIESMTFSRDELCGGTVLTYLLDRDIDVVVLAGFLWLIPAEMVTEYSGRMINIHPSLLPSYGGAGMYGRHVHEAVHSAGDRRSGMTIHLVTEEYDEGQYILQSSVRVTPDDTAEDIGAKVLRLEHHYYPQVVEGICRYL